MGPGPARSPAGGGRAYPRVSESAAPGAAAPAWLASGCKPLQADTPAASAATGQAPPSIPPMPYALIALPVPVRQLFTYRVPEALDTAALPGVPVEVPFRGRTSRGVLVERIVNTPLDNVRDISRVLGTPLLSSHVLALAKWVADYYLAPPGEVVAAALPGGQEGFARSRARREGAAPASEDRVLRMPIPERLTLIPAQRDAAV